jgi:uncharacterized protein (DUF3084 family)
MAAPPGLSEVVRRLDDLATDVRGLRADLDKTYLRQDVWLEAQGALRQEVGEARRRADGVAQQLEGVEKDRAAAEKERANIRRLAVLAIVSALLTPIIAALIAHSMS